MPRKELNIKEFSYGLVDEPDRRDIPLGAGVICTSNDPNAYGVLKGIRSSGSTFHATPTVAQSEWIIRDDGKRDLVYTDNSNIKTLLDFYGTPAAGNTISGAGYSFTPQNKKVFIGMGTSTSPKVAIRTAAAKFNGLIAHTAGSGTDDLVIDASEYDGTADTYYIKITSTTAVSGTYESVAEADSTSGAALFTDTAGHGLEGYNGKLITISGSSISTYDGTYTLSIASDTSFYLLDSSENLVLYKGTGTGNYVTVSGNCAWQWSTDDSNYYPTGGYPAEEWGKIDTHDLIARFTSSEGKTTLDKWTITFSSANTETLYIEDAECYNYKTNNVDDTFYIQIQCSEGDRAIEGVFVESKKYFYGWSIVYDDYEESPIAYRGKGDDITSFSTSRPIESIKIDFKITTTSLPKRITGFHLWSAEANNIDAEKPETEFSYVTSFTLDGARQSSNTYTFKYKDVGYRSMTYENYTGISEVVPSTSVNYTLSAVINDKLFVGNCSRKGVKNATNVLFRSKARQFSIFDWSNELLPLPTKPTAMISFKGRLYVFDESNMYIIEPEGFFVENKYNVGCPYSTAFAITEDAFYWGDTNAAYRCDGGKPEDISTTRIRTTYQTYIAATNALKVVYDSEIKIVMFTVKSGTTIYALSYHVLNQRWDLLQLMTSVSTANWGIFIGKDGESYLSDQTNIRAVFGTTGGAWVWQSGAIDFDSPGEQKRFYYIRVDGTPATIQFKVDDGTLTSVTSTEEVKIGGDWAQGKNLAVKLTGSDSGDYAYSVTIGYRELGKR